MCTLTQPSNMYIKIVKSLALPSQCFQKLSYFSPSIKFKMNAKELFSTLSFSSYKRSMPTKMGIFNRGGHHPLSSKQDKNHLP